MYDGTSFIIKFILKISPYTGWSINNSAIRNLNISAGCRPNELKFLPVIEGDLKYFFHKTKVYKYYFELSPLTRIRKFHIYWNDVNDILEAFFVPLWLPIQPFDRKSCSLSICARPSSLACSL
jgi:hypothetical protein